MPATPVSSFFQGQHQAASEGALLDKDVVCPTPCELQCVVGVNAGSGTLWVQLHDKATPLANGDVPEFSIPVPGVNGSFSLAMPYVFTLGMCIGISTTQLTYTSAGNVLSYAATVHA